MSFNSHGPGSSNCPGKWICPFSTFRTKPTGAMAHSTNSNPSFVWLVGELCLRAKSNKLVK